MKILIQLALLLLFGIIGTAHAQNLDLSLRYLKEDVQKECSESGDFIKNIALARQSGKLTRGAALKRLDDDYHIIRAFHPKFRWFAHNTEDEIFLRAQVASAFDKPMSPEKHRMLAVQACEEYREGEAGM